MWWSDDWSALDYGVEFDFNRPFFEQFDELLKRVPRTNLINKEHENSEYSNFALRNKDSYLLVTSAECEECLYVDRGWKSKQSLDCSNMLLSEYCYECVDISHCYGCYYLQSSSHCSDCHVSHDLQSCHHCFGCVGLRNTSYHIANKQYSPEEYTKAIAHIQQDY